jgi:Cu/Ag efflux protein CusF
MAGMTRPVVAAVLLAIAAAEPARSQDASGLFEGVGVIVAISPTTGSLTINHEEIVGFMPPMEMLFRVDPRTLSQGLRPGDRIAFKVLPKGYVIRFVRVLEKAP